MNFNELISGFLIGYVLADIFDTIKQWRKNKNG